MSDHSKRGTLALVLMLVALWACSDEKAQGPILCAGDADCPEGMGCSNGVCRLICATTDDCPNGAMCLSGYCQYPCDSDSDCPKGEHCENGFCAADIAEDGGQDADAGPVCVDRDLDGYGENCAYGEDCDDSDRLVHPGAWERCNDGIDNNCDGEIDEDDCGCEPGDRRECYNGPFDTDGVGNCKPGIMICTDDRDYGPCAGETLPADEVCDGEDNNCDGVTDEGLANRCGDCEPPDDLLVEICGDGLDNDCNGVIDESCNCDPNCQCEDPNAGTNCECHPPIGQPCYSGPPATLGMGPCVGGTHDCVQQGIDYVWTECVGQVLPDIECRSGLADELDNDCDGMVDEDCLPDNDGDGFSPPEDCDDTNPDVNPGMQETCNGVDDDCNGLLDDGVTNPCGECGPTPEEVCADGLDNNCDGTIDEGCGGCMGDETKECYGGPDGTQGVGHCVTGTMTCIGGEFWSECEGDVVPEPEVCDGEDNDCDTEVDEQWAIGSNACGWCDSTELCDMLDNDCDGLTDEGLRNACGDCLEDVLPETECDGLDNDCDGLIDEDLLTPCGTCPDVPCYEQGWDQPGLCEEDHRLCDGVIPDPADPDSITLGQGSVSTPFIYVAVHSKSEVAKLDTETGQKYWQVTSHGNDPSRTAVALDYSVWVANRGTASIWSPDYSNGVHLDGDGNKLCRVDTPGRCRGVAIDGDGNVWFGTWEGQTVYKVHGSETNNTDCTSPPCCRLLDQINVGTSIYGLAVDGNGFLWGASGNSHSHTTNNTVRLDTATGNFELVSNPSWYGIAVSPIDGRIWYGNYWATGCVHSLTPNPPYTVFNSSVCGGTISGVTVDREGYVWASSYSQNTLYKIDPNSGAVVCSTPVPMPGPGGTDARGVAIDANAKVWVVNRVGGYANRFHPDCTLDETFEVDHGANCYTYSDMTGMQLRLVTTREGHWYQNFDSGYVNPVWHSASWEALVPADTSVMVTFVSADSEAQLVTSPSPACGPFSTPPADLLSCPDLQGHRWLSADVMLTTESDGVRPSFSNLTVFWSR